MLFVFPWILVVSLGWFCLTFISSVSICKRPVGVTVLGAATSQALDQQWRRKVKQELFQHTTVSERPETNSLQQT